LYFLLPFQNGQLLGAERHWRDQGDRLHVRHHHAAGLPGAAKTLETPTGLASGEGE